MSGMNTTFSNARRYPRLEHVVKEARTGRALHGKWVFVWKKGVQTTNQDGDGRGLSHKMRQLCTISAVKIAVRSSLIAAGPSKP
ncbi:hypothetical protein L484_013114 [Morus notabilis]|uniref:Uncharacterized protein n=1 Tax=Morus notabilis TaxID=981085 RepID=W9R1Y9_9ROSA|nr:hypothetical protein L484_013114 [Morus notabilis]